MNKMIKNKKNPVLPLPLGLVQRNLKDLLGINLKGEIKILFLSLSIASLNSQQYNFKRETVVNPVYKTVLSD